MLIIWLLVAALGVAAIVWGAETFAEHLAVASTRLGVSMFALAVLLAGAETPMMAAATDEEGGGIAAMIPNGRMAEPEEVAALMVWLASDESSYITGTEQVIDAGLTAQ